MSSLRSVNLPEPSTNNNPTQADDTASQARPARARRGALVPAACNTCRSKKVKVRSPLSYRRSRKLPDQHSVMAHDQNVLVATPKEPSVNRKSKLGIPTLYRENQSSEI